MKKQLTIGLIILIGVVICGAFFISSHKSPIVSPIEKKEVEIDEMKTLIPSPQKNGGYKITTKTMECLLYVDGEYKYSSFESFNHKRKIEYYASPTQMIILDNKDGLVKYAKETYEDIDQTYPNPLTRVYNELDKVKFKKGDKLKVNDIDYNSYVGEKVVSHIAQQQIPYVKYDINTKWEDKDTSFGYYEYQDGSTLLSAEAPREISPLLTKDTPWEIDIDNLVLRNNSTSETIEIEVSNKSEGKGISMKNDKGEKVEQTMYVTLYKHPSTNKLEYLKYSKDENATLVQILNDYNIKAPSVYNNMIKMDEEELKGAMMLIQALEFII